MLVIQDQAVVLTRVDYSETSQILVLFTREHGQVRAIAKGIKRSTKTRFAVGIDVLEIGRVVISNRRPRSSGLATITEWKQTQSLLSLRSQLDRILAAQYAAEITAHLTEDRDPHQELFDALVIVLVELSQAPDVLEPIVGYQRRLLAEIGSWPRFDACVLCKRRDDLTHFSSFEGGMICRHCEPVQVEKWAVSPETLETVKQSASRRRSKAALRQPARTFARPDESDREGSPKGGSLGHDTRSAFTGAFSLLNYHISHLMGREPRLASRLVPTTKRRIVE